MEGKALLPYRHAAAFAGVVVGGARRAQVGGVDHAFGIQYFRVAHLDVGSGWRFDAQANAVDQVLTEIEAPISFVGTRSVDVIPGDKGFMLAHRHVG